MAARNLTKKFVDSRNAAKANRTLRSLRDDHSEESDSGLLRVHVCTSISRIYHVILMVLTVIHFHSLSLTGFIEEWL